MPYSRLTIREHTNRRHASWMCSSWMKRMRARIFCMLPYRSERSLLDGAVSSFRGAWALPSGFCAYTLYQE